MTQHNPENFFDNTGGGSGAPSISLKRVDDYVSGTIVDQFMAEAKKFGTDDVERDSKTGAPIQQLVVILQTDLRDWMGVSRIPWIDPNDQSKGQKPASEDDGKRALYVKPWTNIHAAVGDAVKASNGGKPGPLQNGGKLDVKIVNLKDTGKGNPLKEHAARYTPPAPGGDFFGAPGQGTQAPAQSAPPQQAPQSAPPAQAAPAQDPWSTSTPPGPPAGGDPWATPQQGGQAAPPPF